MQETPRPNLFIVGAMKAGTTSLHHYLSLHPDVFMAEPKEPGHFANEMTYYPKDLGWYLDLFAGAGDAAVIGESSTHYTKRPVYPGVAERLAAFSPDAKIVYLMRDPIERAVSHYWHNVRTFDEARPMLAAVREDVQYRAFSDYAMQIEPYLRHFGRERVLLLTFEQFTAEPLRVVREVLAWLGVDPERTPESFEKKNARPEAFMRSRGSGVVNEFRNTRLWNAVSPLVPKRLRASATRRFAVEPAQVDPEIPREVVDYLRPLMLESTERLQQLLGREFPEWTTLHAPAAPAAAGAV